MFSFLSSMIIDEARAHVLTKYSKAKVKAVVTKSDHNPIICLFNQLWSDSSAEQTKRYEIFQFNNSDGLKKFNEMTSSNKLSDCFEDRNLKQSSKKWLKTLNNCIHRSFKKIRITNRKLKHDEVHDLMLAKSQIQIKIDEILHQLEVDQSDVENSSLLVVRTCGSPRLKNSRFACIEKCRKIKDHFSTITDCTGSFNVPKMWGLKKKLNLNSNDVPSAKKDKGGNLVTTKNGLTALYKNTYVERLSHKSIRPELEDLKSLKENLFNIRYELASKNKSVNWDVTKIEKVCKALKNSKARDECGLIYELFKPPFAGQDVYNSLMKMFNLIKKELVVPDFFELMSITSLYKNKGL